MAITKKDVICDIIRAYKHNPIDEGGSISKRRLWYILKPAFTAANLSGITHKGAPVTPVTNADYNKHFNALAEAGEIDDTFIQDNSRVMEVGSRLPHIIVVAEKKTVETTAMNLSERLGISYYISGGYSSIYGARKLLEQIETDEPITLLVMSDYDKAGYEIEDTVARHLGAEECHRTLITPDQIPEEKVDEFFGESAELGLHYELDVLNIHQLESVFLAAIPEHIAVEIKALYQDALESQIQEETIESAIDHNPQVMALRRQLIELETKLWVRYESAFLEAEPILINDYEVDDIYHGTVEYEVDDWLNL